MACFVDHRAAAARIPGSVAVLERRLVAVLGRIGENTGGWPQVRIEFEDPDRGPGGRYPLSLNDRVDVELERTPLNRTWTAYRLTR